MNSKGQSETGYIIGVSFILGVFFIGGFAIGKSGMGDIKTLDNKSYVCYDMKCFELGQQVIIKEMAVVK